MKSSKSYFLTGDRNHYIQFWFLLILSVLFAHCTVQEEKHEVTTIWLIGDSTMADYSLEKEYNEKRFPLTGWGQVFQEFFIQDSLHQFSNIIQTDSVIVRDQAKGGRSTRTFFQEGRWREVYTQLKANDFVLIQFGHNDASVQKTERYVNEQGYQEFLRLYVDQARERNAIPVLLTPVARNYPWKNDTLHNVHGNYPKSMKEIAVEKEVALIDVNELSMQLFTKKGRDYVTENFFMNLPEGEYEAYPEGQNDNTHFQTTGALEVARIVAQELKKIEMRSNQTK